MRIDPDVTETQNPQGRYRNHALALESAEWRSGYNDVVHL